MNRNPHQLVLPEFSNREDLYLTLAFFDDDTNEAANIAGTTGQGTFAFWNVTDGSISTTSNSSLTIGPQLLAATVGTGLAIAVGDVITFADVSGLNTMTGIVTAYNSASGAIAVQVGWTFQMEIRRTDPTYNRGSGYEPYYDWGSYNDFGPIITAAIGNGLTMLDTGVLLIWIPELQMKALHFRTYSLCMTAFDGARTFQVVKATLPIQYGGVTN